MSFCVAFLHGLNIVFVFFTNSPDVDSTVDSNMGTLQYDSRSSEYGSLSRQLYATDVSTGKTVALACTPPGTGADGASCPIFQANRGPKYWAIGSSIPSDCLKGPIALEGQNWRTYGHLL